MNENRATLRRRTEGMAVIAIFLFGALLRFSFLDFGLPGMYLEDEEFFVSPALTMDEHRAVDPGWYGAPGHTLIYAVFGVFRMVNWALNVGGDPVPVHLAYDQAVTCFQTSGSVVPALLGSLSVLLAYWIGRHWSRRAGMFSALLFATSYYFVEHAHIIRPDIPQTFFLLGATWFVFRAFRQPDSYMSFVGAGVFWGLAVMTKYPSLFFGLPLLAAAIWFAWRGSISWRQPTAGAIGSLVAAFASGPFVFLRWEEALQDVWFENRLSHGVHGGLGFFGNAKWYVAEVLPWEVGTVLLIVAIGMVTIFLVRGLRGLSKVREQQMVFLGLASISYLLCISSLHLHWERWAIPVTAFLLIFAAVGIDLVLSLLQGSRLLTALFLVLIFAGPGMRLARTMYGFSQPHTIAQAEAWAQEHLPDGAVVVSEPYTPKGISGRDVETISVPNIGWYPVTTYEKQGATHFWISGSIYSSIEELAQDPSNADAQRAMRWYDQSIRNAKPLITVRPGSRYSRNTLIMDDDFAIWRSVDIRLLRGDSVHLYEYTFPLVQ